MMNDEISRRLDDLQERIILRLWEIRRWAKTESEKMARQVGQRTRVDRL
jgi:hypothetical protein